MRDFNVASLLQEGFEKYKANWLAGIIVTLAYAVLFIIPMVGQFVAPLMIAAFANYGLLVWGGRNQLSVQEPFSLSAPAYLKAGVVFIALALIQLALMKVYSHLITTAYEQGLWFSFSFYFPYFSSILVGMLGYFFLFSYPFLVVEKNVDIGEALKTSFSLSLNNAVNLIVFILVAAVLNFIGALPCGIGLLVTVPLTLVASAGLYKKLVGEASSEPSAN